MTLFSPMCYLEVVSSLSTVKLALFELACNRGNVSQCLQLVVLTVYN